MTKPTIGGVGRLGPAVLAACLYSSPAAQASNVTESEVNGASSNNTLAAAQSVPAGAFTPNVSPSVFGNLPTASVLGQGGGDDVDFYAFQAGPGGAYFDIDGAGSTFDTYLALFDGGGTLLGDDDDSFPADSGSLSDHDAFLGVYNLPSAGTYYIAVARYDNFASATFSGTDFDELTRPDAAFGGFSFVGSTPGDASFDASGPQIGDAYTLHISVPEPASGLLILLALSGAVQPRRT